MNVKWDILTISDSCGGRKEKGREEKGERNEDLLPKMRQIWNE